MTDEQIVMGVFILLFFGGLLAFFTFTTIHYLFLAFFENGGHFVLKEKRRL